MKNSWITRLTILLLVLGLPVMVYLVAKLIESPQANEGDTVSLHYTLSLDDGEVYYSSDREKPQAYTLGKGLLLPGFEAAITGMRAGESKTITLPFMEAYGPYQTELLMEVNRSKLPAGSQPAVGLQLQTNSPSGNPIVMVITDVTESTVTLDANHPLAGRNLTFVIELLAVETNQTWVDRVDLRWVLLGIVGVAFIIALLFFFKRKLRLPLERDTTTINERI